MPLNLPEDLCSTVMAAAALIALAERNRFLIELADELGPHSVIGPGVVHRCAAELQRRYTVEARSMAIFDEKRDAARGRRGSADG
jgi:hypothetical protein